MSAFGNFLWIVLGGGILLFIEYLVGGLVLCFTMIRQAGSGRRVPIPS